MKPQEITIGNWITVNGYTTQCTIEHLMQLTMKNQPRTKIRGIKLTDDILIKLGFQFSTLRNSWMKGKITLAKIRGNYWMWLDFILIKYVHQLQNLYFLFHDHHLTLREGESI